MPLNKASVFQHKSYSRRTRSERNAVILSDFGLIAIRPTLNTLNFQLILGLKITYEDTTGYTSASFQLLFMVMLLFNKNIENQR